MLTPKHIAFVAAIALATPILVLPLLRGSPAGPGAISLAVSTGLIVGTLVWVGTYFGARRAPPQQRTVWLVRVLGVLYLLVGVVMVLPVKTHAVLIEARPGTGKAGPLDSITPIIYSVGSLLLMVVVPMFLARGIAMLCGRSRSGDA